MAGFTTSSGCSSPRRATELVGLPHRAWDRDQGWRIDHIYLCDELLNRARSCSIHKDERGRNQPSDHAPVSVDLDWPPAEEDLDDDPFF